MTKKEIQAQLRKLLKEITGRHFYSLPENIEEILNFLRVSVKYCMFDNEALTRELEASTRELETLKNDKRVLNRTNEVLRRIVSRYKEAEGEGDSYS